jgi:hypothetical protein
LIRATGPLSERLEHRRLFSAAVGNGVPLSPPSSPFLEPGSDSGPSDFDHYTNALNPVFDIITANASATVRLYRNGTVVASRTGPGAITDNDPPEGVTSYEADQTLSGETSTLSGPLTVTFDRTIATPGPPDLEATSDNGVSNTDNITNVSTPVFDTTTGIEAGQTTVQLLRDGLSVAGRTGAGSLTAPSTPDGNYTFSILQTDLAGNQAGSTALSVSIDTLPPILNGGAPTWSYQTVQSLTYSFSENVQASLSVGELVVQKTTPPSSFVPDLNKHLSYDPNLNIATLTFTTVPLADGNYTAAITGPITDVAGNSLVNGGSLNFFTFAGDTDANRNVNVADLANVAGNFGKTNGQTWINGDFDYNHNVNVADLADLAGNFGKTLAAGTGETGVLAAMQPAAAPVFSSQIIAGGTDASDAQLLLGDSDVDVLHVRTFR